MDAAISRALNLTDESTVTDRTVDITTTGARSGEPRRIEIWFHTVDGHVYLTGTPGARAWYANLLADPRLTFHLKHGVRADLPATGAPITDAAERDRVFRRIVAGIEALYARMGSRARLAPVDEWIANSPLVRVSFD
jgi:deazaflavin-dependent oxidoreductase (nitroreductase family)